MPQAARSGRWARVCLGCLAGALALGAGGAADSLETYRQRHHEVRLQLTVERARVLREDPAAIALRERIEGLYRELDRVVSANPTVARLEADLARLEEALRAQTPAGARPAEGAPP